ncbi:hypothetical protein CBR_g23908 [Chara braunii]|uniref:DUF659 domain-containing protein n=1 Tax=Chara braunii TaxID=69332 RepID=A0A388L557_CHABU|nr:hypothetical protein CBR_g23908 [Chara braunii]|eukprot:GBG77459.1 hypothetical protein CBR_g23908 [Chara braunii]
MRTNPKLQDAISEARDRAERRCRRDGVTTRLWITVAYHETETSMDTADLEQVHQDRDSGGESETKPVEEGPKASSRQLTPRGRGTGEKQNRGQDHGARRPAGGDRVIGTKTRTTRRLHERADTQHSSSQAVKQHFREVGIGGQADKGNKKRVCNYCDKPVAGTASRAREHFLKGSRCDVERLRGTIPKEEYLRREKGRSAARSELGANMREPEMEESSEDENAPRTLGGVLDPSGSAARLRQTNPRTSTTGVVDPSRSVVGLRQTTITDSAAVITAHEQTQRTIDDWMTAECIPFNMMKSEYSDKMVHALMNAPKGFTYAKFENARTKRVEVTRGRAPSFGEVCMSRRNKGASAYDAILKRAIEEIDAEAVVGVIMDNAAVCEAAGRMIEADYPHIFSVPCTAHSLDLMFESFAKIGWVGAIIKRASELAKFFTNHSRVRDLLIHYSNGGVVSKPGTTRFATNFIMLSSLQGLYLPLRACVTDDDLKPTIVHTSLRDLFVKVTHSILDDTLWEDVEKVMQTSKNLLKLLKKVDGTGPTISKVYARMDNAVEKLRESKHFAKAEKDELEEIIMRRWNAMTSPLHCAALFLDPEYRASRPETDAEVADGFWMWLYSWCKESSFVEVDAEADQGSPQWEEDEPLEDLTRDEMAKDARMRLAEWRARLHRTESVSDAGDEEAQGVKGGSLAEGPAPARLTRKRGRPQKQPVQEEEEVAPEGTGSDENGGGADENNGGGDESDGSGNGDDGSGGCDGTDGSGKEDEGEGDEKDGCSSEEEGDSESEPLSKSRKTSH